MNSLKTPVQGKTTKSKSIAGEKSLSPRKKGLKSTAVAASIIFIGINAVLMTAGPGTDQFDQYKFPYKGWAWWLMKDLNATDATYNAAILGSSLTVSALNSADATHYQENLDLVHYHKSRLFDEKLARKTGVAVNTFNLSTPGQMPSDALMTIKAMIKTGQKPNLVVYGIAPRDFIDSELAGPQDTEPFTYLSRVVDIGAMEDKIFTSPLDKINRALQKNLYFYKHAVDLQMTGYSDYESFMERFVPAPPSSKNKPFTYWDRVKLLPEYKKGEFHPQANMCNPDDLSKPSEYIDNSIEYVHRYKKPNPVAFETQMFFLNQLSEFTAKNGITLVVVNMPITLDNLKLLKQEHYDKYMDRVRQFASASANTEFYDMNNHDVFTKPDFHDGVHMNARGGIKFIDLLTDRLAASGTLNRAFPDPKNLKISTRDIDEKKSTEQ